jgi:hypothetical protein
MVNRVGSPSLTQITASISDFSKNTPTFSRRFDLGTTTKGAGDSSSRHSSITGRSGVILRHHTTPFRLMSVPFDDLLLSSHLDREGGNVRDMIRLRPNEGVVIRISVGNHSDLLRFEHQTRTERNIP